MFKNYFTIAWRNMRRNKVFSLINIMGLALGLACSLLIMLSIQDEYKFDTFFKNGDRIYSIFEKQYRDGAVFAFYGGPGVLADEMKRVLPQVQYATNYAWNELSTFEANDKIIKETGNHGGIDFFNVFSYALLEGSPNTALASPSDIAISKKMAIEFFGSPHDAIGKTIRYQNAEEFKVSAVFDDMPQHSTIQVDYLLTWQQFLKGNDWAREWGNNGPGCFFMLRPGTDPKVFEQKISHFLDGYNKEQTPHSYIRLGMALYGNIYMHSNFDKAGNISGGRFEYAELFSMVAIFILIIACINFMNLTTARSAKRAKEIGVRKVAGAARLALIRQFIGETLFIVSIATCIALLLVALMLPPFNALSHKQIHFPIFSKGFWLAIAGLIFVTGIISGSYPALYLSSFMPAKVLKGLPKFSNSALWFRKGLVVFQFVLSIILIIGTIVVSKQVNFIQTVNLGYDRENLIYVTLEGDLVGKYELFHDEALNMPGIQAVSRMIDNPTQIDNGTGGVQWVGKDPTSDIQFTQSAVGYDFTKTMRLKLAAGRDYSRDFATDSAGYLINESALKIIGYKNPVGMPLTFWKKKGTIIGVLRDFHFNSMHETIQPLVLRLGENLPWGQALVRTQPGQTKQALASLEKLCKELNPKFPFTYKFSDEEYAKLYQGEQVVSKLASYFAFLAIFISCLGLLGLVMFTAEQRTKEFGIRKVLGASSAILFNLLAKDFLLYVVVALIIASPIAWIAMNNWLLDYSYKISISWWMFALAGLLVILVALATISFQSAKAALAKPVNSLRTE
ncbi:MAG TPA: ABC transporter permease [Puia sp.]|nr:ABC transporter permease [Puia sp.]